MNEQLSRSVSEFTVSLFHILSRHELDNLIFSPASIAIALAMCYAGAAERTADQMKQLLFSSIDNDDKIHDTLRALLLSLESQSGVDNNKLTVANRVYCRDTVMACSNFLDTIQNRYQSQFRQVSFRLDSNKIAAEINDWIAKTTHNKIKDIVFPISDNTALLFINVIYFKGKWANQFEPQNTVKEKFFMTKNKSSKAEMMVKSNEDFLYVENELWQIVEIVYEDAKLSMIIFLPKEKCGLTKVEKQFSGQFLIESILSVIRGSKRSISVLKIPKFKLELQCDLNGALRNIGCTDMFDAKMADFTKITGQPNEFYVSNMIHKAYVQINEEGCEAAAVTEITVCDGFSSSQKRPTIEFVANHPFLFIIWHRISHIPLFFGRLTCTS